jgi:hypothetical protein
VLNFFEPNPEQVERVRGVPAETQATLTGNKVAQSPTELLHTPLRK